ncbi:MAG: DNA topoisomerase, partial [Acidobacteriota bacterium]
ALQVECNKKYSFTAEETLKYIQNLYEKKMVTYPRVDTTFLPTDMYPKIKGILKSMEPYRNFIEPLLANPIRKSKKVFDDAKITDHHAIIPTGVKPSGLQLEEKRVYDLIARRFIAAFYPDCIVSNITVLGKVMEYEFKATGKEILEEGWRVLYPKKESEKESDSDADEDQIMPHFEKGEKGEHEPKVVEKQTQPPKMLTEATLLRAMETAGKQVQDEELRELMKENGIGRPSTRANIIETLFKRRYITREKKNLVPTQTGIQLIHTIQNELLKSVELTGMWEKKLRQIERGEYEPKQFLAEMKEMVAQLVEEVKRETKKMIVIEQEAAASAGKKSEGRKSEAKKKQEEGADTPRKPNKAAEKKAVKKPDDSAPIVCPKCKKGTMLKGKTAFGCSEYRNGCTFKVMFEHYGILLSDKQIRALIQKGTSPKIKGLHVNGETVDAALTLDASFNVIVPPKQREKGNASETPSLF